MHSIKVSIIQIIDKKVYMTMISTLKQTKSKKYIEPLSFMVYNKEPK